MTHEEFREYEDAADKLCGECLNNDGDECDKCWVRRTLDRLRDNVREEA
jgi:hypothetical protein